MRPGCAGESDGAKEFQREAVRPVIVAELNVCVESSSNVTLCGSETSDAGSRLHHHSMVLPAATEIVSGEDGHGTCTILVTEITDQTTVVAPGFSNVGALANTTVSPSSRPSL